MCQGPGAEPHLSCMLREYSEGQSVLSGISIGHVLGEKSGHTHSPVNCHMDAGSDSECRWDFILQEKV